MSPPVTVYSGDRFKTNGSGWCTVIEYINAKEILVKFEKYHVKLIRASAAELRRGKVENPYQPVVRNRGFIGRGKYNSTKHKKLYNQWAEMFRRCYDPMFQANNPTYAGCSVHEDWYNFQTFCAWAIAMPNQATKNYCLDKDLRIIGNKMYCATACSFVPNEINTMFGGNRVSKSSYPGVRYNSECTNPYYIRYQNKNYYFETGKDAYLQHLKIRLRETFVLAEKNKGNIHKDIYNNLKSLDKRTLSRLLFEFYLYRRV